MPSVTPYICEGSIKVHSSINRQLLKYTTSVHGNYFSRAFVQLKIAVLFIYPGSEGFYIS